MISICLFKSRGTWEAKGRRWVNQARQKSDYGSPSLCWSKTFPFKRFFVAEIFCWTRPGTIGHSHCHKAKVWSHRVQLSQSSEAEKSWNLSFWAVCSAPENRGIEKGGEKRVPSAFWAEEGLTSRMGGQSRRVTGRGFKVEGGPSLQYAPSPIARGRHSFAKLPGVDILLQNCQGWIFFAKICALPSCSWQYWCKATKHCVVFISVKC